MILKIRGVKIITAALSETLYLQGLYRIGKGKIEGFK
jgi:hypothetical protein